MPFVAFGVDEELALFETLPQSHTCDNVLEIPNYWRSILATERAAARSAARAKATPAAAETAPAADLTAEPAAEPTLATAEVAASEESSASAPAEDHAAGGAAAEVSSARATTETEEEEEECDRDDEIATDVTPTAEQREALHAHVRAKLLLAITMTSSYGLDDA